MYCRSANLSMAHSSCFLFLKIKKSWHEQTSGSGGHRLIEVGLVLIRQLRATLYVIYKNAFSVSTICWNNGIMHEMLLNFLESLIQLNDHNFVCQEQTYHSTCFAMNLREIVWIGIELFSR